MKNREQRGRPHDVFHAMWRLRWLRALQILAGDAQGSIPGAPAGPKSWRWKVTFDSYAGGATLVLFGIPNEEKLDGHSLEIPKLSSLVLAA